MKKTALLEKLASGQRARGASHGEYSMEFSDLLDEIAPQQNLAELDASLADLVMFSVSYRFDPAPDPIVVPAEDTIEDTIEGTIDDTAEQTVEEIVTAPAKVSRFASSGIDDDLLPVHAPRRRLHRR